MGVKKNVFGSQSEREHFKMLNERWEIIIRFIIIYPS